MKKILLLLALLCPSLYSAAQVSFGKPEKINNGWKFVLADNVDFATERYDDSKWSDINLPHDWSVKGQLSPTLASCTGYLPGGIGWYRKTFTVPETKKGEKLYLYFEGVYNRSEVYLNGHLLGKRPNGYVSFLYDATPHIRYGEENTVSVRVDHSQSEDSRWYTGSGIYRNVWLVYAQPVHIAQWGVYAYPTMRDAKNGVLNIEVEVENGNDSKANLSIINELFDTAGRSVAKDSKQIRIASKQNGKIATTLNVKNPQLWSLETPRLYTLTTTVMDGKKEIDKTSVSTGFRTFAFDPDKGFALNGKGMKMKGVCIHHDAGVLGAAVPVEVWKRRLLALKEIGCNAIRTSHNPQAPDLYQLCDELGFLVMNEAFDEWEFPKRKWLKGWNVGTPGFQGAYDFFEEWGEKDLADIICRDRNHLSIFAWSIGNEVDYPNDPYSHPVLDGGKETGFTQPIFGGYKKDAPDAMRLGGIAKRLAAVVKKYDKSRSITAGLAGVAMSNETEYPDALDIAGYNYTESLYDSDHKKYPRRVIYGSENRHEIDAWKAVRDNEYIFGQFLWTGIDYLGESGRWPSRGFYSGLLDFGGFIKPRGYFRQALWSEKPMAYIGTYPVSPNRRHLSQDAWPVWNYDEGKNICVVCYTNTAEARLELNGKIVGETKGRDDNTGIIHWNLPFQAGKLEVVGMNEDGKEVCRNAISSSGAPHAITIQSADTDLSRHRAVSQVVIQVVDKDGIPVMLSDNEIKCEIEGPATLLGLEASNNEDMSDYTDNKHRVYHGRMIAYLESNGQAGQVNVKFTSPWLKSAETIINVR